MRIQCVVGLDIGGTNCRIGFVDREYNLYHPQICYTADLQNSGDFIKELEIYTASYIDMYKDKFDAVAISMGFPSTIDKERRVILSTPNIPGLDQVPIVSIYEKAFQVPVFINRDVNMQLLHDLNYFKISKDAITLGFYMGTGLGNAIYINNEILLGKNGVAGELGHIPMLGKKKRCSCGNEACIEALAGGRYLEELCQTKFEGTSINEIYVKHGNSPELMEQIEYMAIPIATEVNIFDPDYIILGGGILQMEGFPRERFEENILKHTRKPFPSEGLQILYALMEQENGIIGAGIYGYDMLKDNTY
jgi:allose kinase